MDKAANKTGKIVLLYGFLLFASLIFLLAISQILFSERELPTLNAAKSDNAIRGNIYSRDHFHLATSKKLYKAVVNTYCIDPNKREMFVKLFSIYSGIEPEEIKKQLRKQGNVVLSYHINAKQANHLKQLARKFNAMQMFVEHEDAQGRIYKYGLSIIESGEKREYLYDDILQPLIGYVKKTEDGDYTRVAGVKGLEKYYEDYLVSHNDGLMSGARDIGFNLILNKEGELLDRSDGYDLHLHIYLELQKKLERLLDEARENLKAKEVLAAIMESDTGRMLAMGSSGRFDPNRIQKKDYPYLNASAAEYSFEPGSVIKPLVFALLLDKQLINPLETIELHNGRYRIGRKTITDTHPVERSTIKEVLIHSSNIGMAKIAQKLEGVDYRQGLMRLGFAKKTEIDLPYESQGVIPSSRQLGSQIYRATVSYGYGLRATFFQLLAGYNVFNTSGKLLTPRIASHLEDRIGNKFALPAQKLRQVLRPATAQTLQQILIETVEKGTGKKAEVEGVTVGGKTGTAHIAERGRYVNRYNSSFFGFANDKAGDRRYTIGVVVFEPDETKEYFASQTAVPVFKNIVELLVHEGLITAVLTEKEREKGGVK